MPPLDAPVNQAPASAPVSEDASASIIEPGAVRSARRMTLLLLFVAAAVLRIANLAAKPFWFDECFSAELARLDWRNVLHLLWWREANMSLHYVLLRAWLRILAAFGVNTFNDSEFLIRSLSVVIAVSTLPAIYWLARLLYDRRVALIAAALFTFNAYSVRYSQEARGYALFLLLTTLSSGFLIRWLGRPVRGYLASYAVVSVLAVYAHLYAVLLIAAHWIVLRWIGAPFVGSAEENAGLRWRIQRAWKTIGIAVLPLLIFVAKTGAGPLRWIRRPDLHHLVKFVEHFCGSDGWALAVIYALAIISEVVPLGSKLLKRRRKTEEANDWQAWRAQFLLVWLLFPVVLTLVLSFARPVFLGRYMFFCLPALLILAAAGLSRLPRSWMLAAVLTLMLFLSLRGVFFVYGHDFDNERDASGASSNYILDHTQAGDGVIFHIAEGRVPYEFFRSERAGENSASPEFARILGPDIIFPNHGPGLDYRDFTGKPTEEFLRAIAPSHPRLWVMLIDNGKPGSPDPTTIMLTATLPESFPSMQHWQFPHVELRLYSK
jgi:mannosyltransferase